MVRLDMDKFVDYAGAAEIRGVKYRSIQALVKRGRLPFVQIGRHKFIKRKDVENFKVEKPGPKGKQ